RPAGVPLETTRPHHSTSETTVNETAPLVPSPTSAGAPAPVIDPLFAKHWPDVVRSGRPVVLAALVVGFLGGVLLPEHDMGLAFFVVLAAAGSTVSWAAKHRRDPFTLTCLVLAGLCTLPVVLLDAEWIAVLCVLAGASILIAG